MKLVCLLSGSQASTFALAKALAHGHEVICIATIIFSDNSNSQFIQNLGQGIAPAIAKALDKPLIWHISLTSIDDVQKAIEEILYESKCRFPQIQGVLSGVIDKDQNRKIIERAAANLQLSSLTPLWRSNRDILYQEMVQSGVQGVIVNVDKNLKDKLNQPVGELNAVFDTCATDSWSFSYRIILNQVMIEIIGDRAQLLIENIKLEDKDTGNQEDLIFPQLVTPKVFKSLQYFYVGEISARTIQFSEGQNLLGEAYRLLYVLKITLEQEGFSLQDIHYVNVYLQDMSQFQEFNQVYSHFFSFPNPPCRVCIEVCNQTEFIKIALKGGKMQKQNLHVQSITDWAPRCIPFSNAYKVNDALYLSGMINQVPITLELNKDDPLGQIVSNCQNISKFYSFELENPELCIQYYVDAPALCSPTYKAFNVQVTALPFSAPIELEFYLQEATPDLISLEEHLIGQGYDATIKKRQSNICTYLIWQIEIEDIQNVDEFLCRIADELTEYFSQVQHKSPMNEEDLLVNPSPQYAIWDYVTDVRVYGPQAQQFDANWLKQVPAVFVNSYTKGMLIVAKDYLQLKMTHFLTSKNY